MDVVLLRMMVKASHTRRGAAMTIRDDRRWLACAAELTHWSEREWRDHRERLQMDNEELRQRFGALTTAHLADACLRVGLDVRCAPANLQAVPFR
jgi:1,2-phenylacetyl-CoA epoxidase catalytic subunit